MNFSFKLRKKRTEQQIKRILAEVFALQVRDERIRNEYLSVTAVELSDNFHFAKVYYSIVNEKNKKKVEDLLKKMGGFISGKLKAKLKTKHLPRLEFIYRKSEENEEVADLLEKLGDN